MPAKRKWIDRNLLKELCESQCSNDEIAAALRVSWDTLDRRYAGPIKIWRSRGPMSVRRRLYKTATEDVPIYNNKGEVCGYGPQKGAVTAQIFYLKNYGGMADVVKDATPKLNDDGIPVPAEFESAEARKPN